MFRKQIDQAIRSILRKKKQKQHTLIEKTQREIMRLSEFSLNTRYEMINYVNERIEKLTHNSEKVVTPD